MALLAFGEIGELERGGVDEFDGVGLERPAKLDHVGNARNHAASFDVADPRMPGAYHQPKPLLRQALRLAQLTKGVVICRRVLFGGFSHVASVTG